MTNPARGVTQPNNVAGQAGDYVNRVQLEDSSGNTGSSAVVGTVVEGGVATLTDGRTTVTTHGTAVALASTAAIKWVTVTGLTSNAQQVNVGASTVLAASGTQRGVPLLPGDSVSIPVNDISKVFVDSRVDGEGVAWLAGV